MSKHRTLTSQRAAELHEQLKKDSNANLADVIERNIDIIELMRRKQEARRAPQERFADRITAISGSMAFFYGHVFWFGIWVPINLGAIPGLKPFDPFPFGLLTMIVSLEAIFLSTFVLLSQNRQAVLTEQHASLDLQINLLAEYEVTRMLRLVDKMAEKMGIEDAYDAEIDQLCLPVAPDVLLFEIEAKQRAQEDP